MRRLACIPALAAVLLLTAPAPAGAADVGRQVERRAPARFPEVLAGCRSRCNRGQTIPRGWVLLSRTVRLAPRERRAPVVFRCPGSRRFSTFGSLQSADVGIHLPDDQLPYVRRRRVRAFGIRGLAPLSRPSSGTLYALCVPR